MSSTHHAVQKTPWDRVLQGLLLATLFALLWGATRIIPRTSGSLDTIAAIGFLLLAGTLTSELFETLSIPHLTGYLVAGIVAGPHVLHLLDHDTVEFLQPVNALALALIAFAGGAELKLDLLRKGFRSLMLATGFQTLLCFLIPAAMFIACRPLLPFAQTMGWTAVFGVAALWGGLAVSRSPSATLGILAQTRAQGPIAQFTLAFVMLSDVVVVVFLSGIITLVRPLVEPGSTFSLSALNELGHELLASVALGTTLGLLLVVYCKFVGRHLVLVFVALGIGFSEVILYLRFEPLLTFLSAGFVVQNLSDQGEKFLHSVEDLGSVVFVVFFATAGAHLNLPLLKSMWPVALIFFFTRVAATIGANAITTRVAGDPPVLQKLGWSGLVSQAGVTIGLSGLIERTFPGFGSPFRALAIATVAINEMVGPILFKSALDRMGESTTVADRERAPGTEESEEASA